MRAAENAKNEVKKFFRQTTQHNTKQMSMGEEKKSKTVLQINLSWRAKGKEDFSSSLSLSLLMILRRERRREREAKLIDFLVRRDREIEKRVSTFSLNMNILRIAKKLFVVVVHRKSVFPSGTEGDARLL